MSGSIFLWEHDDEVSVELSMHENRGLAPQQKVQRDVGKGQSRGTLGRLPQECSHRLNPSDPHPRGRRGKSLLTSFITLLALSPCIMAMADCLSGTSVRSWACPETWPASSLQQRHQEPAQPLRRRHTGPPGLRLSSPS